MVVALIIACEVGFWVLLALGLGARYLLRWRRTSVVLLLCEPVLELVLFAVTAWDLKNGAEPGWEHGLAALYIGYTVAYGHYTIRWLDGHAAHRLAGGPPPAKPPRYGMPRARHEGALWLRTLLAAAVAGALLQGAVWYVGDGGDASSLRSFQWTALRVAALHGVIALTYLLWPKKAPESEPGPRPGTFAPAPTGTRLEGTHLERARGTACRATTEPQSNDGTRRSA
ncbi:hypothetical protein [Streptomyces sp. A13(2022)]|uniref:hypothetical protein n=1 Tax=Streptomyces sp. A13(2022) TaxID=2964768 RepID=UPI0021D85F79|nr:hypothetical protein [Streptomyces sp. A13(2022)]MCU8590461.1 hypothetical protein [Streptomyces sp. A13(2022)]